MDGQHGYGCFTMFVSGIAMILSVISLLKWDDKVSNLTGKSFTIAVLSALITFVVAWQIWQTIKAKQELAEAKHELEKSCEVQLKEFEKRMRAQRIEYVKKEKQLNEKIESIRISPNDIAVIKYYLNDAMGSMHYNDNRLLEGVLDVMENLYLISLHKIMFKEHFQDEYDDKFLVATYFIAKNLKKYRIDQIVNESHKDRVLRRLKTISLRWDKRYKVVSKDERIPSLALDRLLVLDGVFHRLVEGVEKNGKNYQMSPYDEKCLNDMAKD